MNYLQVISLNRSTQLAALNFLLAAALQALPQFSALITGFGALMNAIIAAIPDHVGPATNAVQP